MAIKTRSIEAVLLTGAVLAASTRSATASIITFDGLAHGEVLMHQLRETHGVTISAFNPTESRASLTNPGALSKPKS